MTDLTSSFPGYESFLRDLKQRIQSAQVKAAVAVNSELVRLYWSIGRDILARQAEQGWGAKVVERLPADLRREFPDMKGFSSRNLKYESVCGGLSRRSNCAASCCTNSLVPQLYSAGQNEFEIDLRLL